MPSGVYKRKKGWTNQTSFKKGCIPWNKNIPHSERTKKKIGKANRGNKFRWEGGRLKQQGYILVRKPNHPFPNSHGYVFEHRLVIERQIGRYLTRKEMPHHINKIKDDNRPENLMAFVNRRAHVRFENGNKVKLSEIVFDGRKLKRGIA